MSESWIELTDFKLTTDLIWKRSRVPDSVCLSNHGLWCLTKEHRALSNEMSALPVMLIKLCRLRGIYINFSISKTVDVCKH